MNKYELKDRIKQTELEIKELKRKLRIPHSTYGLHSASIMMSNLHMRKCEVRTMYALYGFFRGKKLSDFDKTATMALFSYQELKLVLNADNEKMDLFKTWVKETT